MSTTASISALKLLSEQWKEKRKEKKFKLMKMSMLLLDQAAKMEEGTATVSQVPFLSVYTSLLEPL